MYIPYFRGKQFDLIGLRDSVSKGLIGINTIPLVEPVRDSKQLLKTLDVFIEHQQKIMVVANPEVGQVQKGVPRLYNWADYYDSPYVIPVYITDSTLKVEDITGESYAFLSTNYIGGKLEELVEAHKPKYHIITDSARLRRVVRDNRILLTDTFARLNSRADYLEIEDEFYCDDYKFIEEDGYLGFSNYGIDGKHYYDKGFPSRTVVLHILYVDKFGSIRIKHFASDSNDSYGDVQVKFHEALGKLVRWQQHFSEEVPVTVGMRELVKYYETEEYPGPGTIKKLLVMHQMELMKRVMV